MGYWKKHKYIITAKYVKKGLKHLGQFETEVWCESKLEAVNSAFETDWKNFEILSIKRNPERIYTFFPIPLFRKIKFWYLSKKRNGRSN